jgi:O-antigen biosynthesis alpha-1,2-rhamnosyltransferase
LRLLVECTYVYEHPRDNSGIQRVVRNIVSKLGKARKIAEAVPVILKNNRLYQVKKLPGDNLALYLDNLLHARLVRTRERYWRCYPRIENRRPFRTWLFMRRVLFRLYKVPDLFLRGSDAFVFWLCHQSIVNKCLVKFATKPDDVLVLLDSSWHSDCVAQFEKLKSQGVTIVSVIYDLIPLTHPRFCDEGLVAVFQDWFRWVGRTADGFMAISRTIRDQAQAYVRQDPAGRGTRGRQWFDYFYLGAELDLSNKNDGVREKVRRVYENNGPVYLMVGTIEPRKNHGYLLDAFELLWREGLNVTLCFVGKVGWKCQTLIERVQTHSEHNRRLRMFNDLSDTELEYCYFRSRCLVFAAYVEGFGLPLVEALQRGLPAMASDIPVFREVGGDFIAYFELERPETLAELVRQYEESGRFPATKKLREWSWLSWEDATKQLLTRIVSNVAENRQAAKKVSAEHGY